MVKFVMSYGPFYDKAEADSEFCFHQKKQEIMNLVKFSDRVGVQFVQIVFPKLCLQVLISFLCVDLNEVNA